ncbi:DNA/RNA non-specific endonuclease [Pseudomonas putida]|uniref:DNA/RNA non-specific endonuclease n=1 Tax=Pseudomonas putida TaxID=303 RepID=UPI0035B5A7C4
MSPCGIKYGELDSLGRPTGVQARLNSSHINSGTHANPNIQPPGFITGAGSNRARGHLLGRHWVGPVMTRETSSQFNSARLRNLRTSLQLCENPRNT